MRLWKIAVLGLVFVMVLSVSFGCVSIPTASSTTTAPPASTTQSAAASDGQSADATSGGDQSAGTASSEFSEFVTFTMNTTSEPPAENDERWKQYQERFNFRVDWIPLQYTERFEKLRIWIATDDLPDVTWIGLNEDVFAEYLTWVGTGLFSEIPDLAPYPNIQAMYEREDMVADELCTFDGKLMSLPAIRDTAPYNYMVCLGYGYRADWAEQLGLLKENHEYTWDEFWEMIQAFIDEDPGGNGPGNTYGISTRMTYFPDIFGMWQSDPYPWTWENASYSAIEGKYEWLPSTDSYINGLKIAKELFDRGLIWPDNLVDTGETRYRELYYAGQMGAMAQNNQLGWVSEVRDKTFELNPDLDREKLYSVAKVSVPGTTDQFYAHSMSCYWSCVNFSAKATDAQKTRFLQTMNWNMSPEGKLHAWYGIEGKDYDVASDGTVTLNWAKDSSGTYTNPYAFGEYYTRLGNDDGAAGLNNVSKNPVDVEHCRELYEWNMANIGDRIKVMDYVQVYTPIKAKETAGTFTIDVRNKATELMANSTVDSIEADWRAWVDTMMPRVQPVLDELNAMEYIPTSADDMMEFVRSGGITK